MLPDGATSVAAPGGALDTPRPVTTRVRLAPFAVKVTLALAVAATVGLKRTVTACVAPTPTRLNEPPDTTLKRSEERRVGKEWRFGWWHYDEKQDIRDNKRAQDW